MNLIRDILVISLLVAFAPVSVADNPFLGPIPVQYATADKDVILDMHRFFHAGGCTLEVRKNPDADIALDAVSLQMRVRPKRPGLIDLELATRGGKETRSTVLTTMKMLDDALTSSEKVYGKETMMSPLVGNHDKGRFMAYADADLPAGENIKEEEVGWKNPPKVNDPSNYSKLELAQAFVMSIDGVPMIYYGDEIGMTGAGDPDNRRDMRFGDQISADEQRVLENFKKLGAIRREHPALSYGSRRTVQADHDVYAFVRAQLSDRIVVAFNRGEADATVNLSASRELPDGDYTEALSGNKVSVGDGKLNLSLPAQTAAFVTVK